MNPNFDLNSVFPRPPDHYRECETENSLEKPNLHSLKEVSSKFYSFGIVEDVLSWVKEFEENLLQKNENHTNNIPSPHSIWNRKERLPHCKRRLHFQEFLFNGFQNLRIRFRFRSRVDQNREGNWEVLLFIRGGEGKAVGKFVITKSKVQMKEQLAAENEILNKVNGQLESQIIEFSEKLKSLNN